MSNQGEIIRSYLNKYSSRILFVGDSGVRCTYSDAIKIAQCDAFSSTQKELFFCIIGNDVDALVGYISIIASDHAALLLPKDIPKDVLLDLIQIYKPSFVWLPIERSSYFDIKRPAHVVLLEGILHSKDAHWSNDIALMNDDEFQRWLNRFRSVSEMALKSQLVSKKTKNDIGICSEAFKKVQGNALKEMASSLKNRLSSDALSIAFAKSDFPITYIKGEKSRVSLPHDLLRLAGGHHQAFEDCGHFPMIDSLDPVVKLLGEI